MSPDVTILNTAMPYDGDKNIMDDNGEGLLVKHIGTGTIHNNSKKYLACFNVTN